MPRRRMRIAEFIKLTPPLNGFKHKLVRLDNGATAYVSPALGVGDELTGEWWKGTNTREEGAD